MVKLKPILFNVIFFLFVLAFSTIATNYDFDFWARLIVGKWFIQTGQALSHDFLSYTPTHIWFDHEWGSGVVFYLTQHFLSSAGIIFLQAILISLIFFFITKIVKLRGCKTTSEHNFMFYYFTFISISYLVEAPVRCQMFTFLFFTVFLYILELARNGKTKPLFILPVLMLFWNNLHGGCVSGIGLIVLYIIGEFLNKKNVSQYFIALVLTILVLPINPWGTPYVAFLFKSVLMPRPLIAEWRGLFYTHNIFDCMKFKIYALVMVSAGFVAVIKQLITKTFDFDKTKYLVLVATVYLAIQHVKFIPFATISMACFLYEDFYSVFNSLTKNIFNKIAVAKDTVIYGFILLFAFSTIKLNGFGPYLDFSRYPVKAVEFIKTNNIKGKLLADFTYGSYIGYKLYPSNTIFMDGRYEAVYEDDLLPMIGHFLFGESGWDALLNKFPPDIILLEKYYPAFRLLKSDKKWKMVYEDSVFAVFVKPENLSKYNHQLKLPPSDIRSYKKTIFDTDIDFRHNSNR